jgi:hypothetical protein
MYSMLHILNQLKGGCEMSAGACPDENNLAAFVCKNLSPAEQAKIEAHLARCDYCCEVVAFVIKCRADLSDFPITDPSDL